MAERFQQACRYEPGNLVRFKTEKPRRLGCVEPGGNDLPTEKFGLLGGDIHTWMAAPRARRGRMGLGLILGILLFVIAG